MSVLRLVVTRTFQEFQMTDCRRIVRRDWARGSSGYCGRTKSNRVYLWDLVVAVALVEVVERAVARSPHWRQASRLWYRYYEDVGSSMMDLMTISLCSIVATATWSALCSLFPYLSEVAIYSRRLDATATNRSWMCLHCSRISHVCCRCDDSVNQGR